MKKFFTTLALAFAALCGGAQAQEQSSKGEVILTLFEHVGVNYNLDNKDWSHPGFNMERAYLGYRYHFDPNWSATVIYDASESNGMNTAHGFVKNAFVQYKNDKLTVMAGIVPTEQGLAAERCWGYRYVNKAFYDMNGWGASADMGVAVKYRFTDWFSADLWMMNGEGFKYLQLDNHYLYALGLNFKPMEGLDMRLYADVKTVDDGLYMAPQENVSLFAGYDHELFRVGAEFNVQNNVGCFEDYGMTGISVFGTYKASPKMNIFCRYDHGSSSDNNGNDFINWRSPSDGQMAMLGMEYRMNKLVSLAPAIRYTADGNGNNRNLYAFLSAKVSL